MRAKYILNEIKKDINNIMRDLKIGDARFDVWRTMEKMDGKLLDDIGKWNSDFPFKIWLRFSSTPISCKIEIDASELKQEFDKYPMQDYSDMSVTYFISDGRIESPYGNFTSIEEFLDEYGQNDVEPAS